MKFSAILAAVAAATVVNAQGYNSTSSASPSAPHTTASVYDSRTVNVPAPSVPPTTALTSIYTITSSCGSVQILLPATSVYPLSSSRTQAVYTGSSTGAAAKTQLTGLAGAGGLMAAAALLL